MFSLVQVVIKTLGGVSCCRWTYSDFYMRYRVLALAKDVLKNNMRKTCENVIAKLIKVYILAFSNSDRFLGSNFDD